MMDSCCLIGIQDYFINCLVCDKQQNANYRLQTLHTLQDDEYITQY